MHAVIAVIDLDDFFNLEKQSNHNQNLKISYSEFS